MKVGDAVAEIMRREGIEILCGYPVNHLLEYAAAADIRPIIVRQERTKSKRRTAPGKGEDRVSVAPPKLRADSAAASLAKTSAPAKGNGSARSPARSGKSTSARSEPKAAASAKNKPTPTRKPMLGTVVDIENWWKARQSPKKPAIPR